MTSKFFISSLVAVLSVSLTGCSTYIMDDIAKKYRFNPNPKEHYQITLTVSEAPGSFEQVKGSIYYEAVNCPVVFQRPGIGSFKDHPKYTKPLALKKLNANTYIGSVYLDALINDDYVGSGICTWKLSSINVEFKATTSKMATKFSQSSNLDNILQERSSIVYFNKSKYPDSPYQNSYAFARTEKEIRPDLRKDFFTIMLTSKKSY